MMAKKKKSLCEIIQAPVSPEKESKRWQKIAKCIVAGSAIGALGVFTLKFSKCGKPFYLISYYPQDAYISEDSEYKKELTLELNNETYLIKILDNGSNSIKERENSFAIYKEGTKVAEKKIDGYKLKQILPVAGEYKEKEPKELTLYFSAEKLGKKQKSSKECILEVKITALMKALN